MRERSRGFALIAVLWVVAGLAALVGTGMLGTRLDAMATENRISLERSRWSAEACLSVAMQRQDSLARARESFGAPSGFRMELGNGTWCEIVSHEPGSRMHLLASSMEMRARLDSIVTATSRLPVDSFLTTDGDGRVDINAAAFEVLTALPGLGPDGARAVVDARRFRRRIQSVGELSSLLPAHVRDSLGARSTEFQNITSFAASSLVLAAIGKDSRAPPATVIEVVIVPVGDRVAVIRRRAL